jgi:hypothetical protein
MEQAVNYLFTNLILQKVENTPTHTPTHAKIYIIVILLSWKNMSPMYLKGKRGEYIGAQNGGRESSAED